MNIGPKAKWAIGIVVIGGVVYGAIQWTRSLGHDDVIKIARDRGYCHPTDACEPEARIILAAAAEKRKMSPDMIEWCVGVDHWAKTRVHRGGILKAILVDVMYWPCGGLRDDASQ